MRLKQFLIEATKKKQAEEQADSPKELKLTKKQIRDLTDEWKLLVAQTEVLTALSKKISNRSNELEKILMPIVKKEESKTLLVKSAMLEYKTRKSTSLSYSKLYSRALEMLTESQVEVIEEFKDSITSSDTKEALNLIDPKLAKLASDIKVMTNDELVSLLPHIRGIMSDDDTVNEASVMDLVKAAMNRIKDCFSGLVKAQNKSMRAARSLNDAALKTGE